MTDTLKSTSYAQVLDLISEGEIGGLVDGLKSIYLDDTPIQNPDGSLNFENVSFVQAVGTQVQPAIAGFNQVENEIGVSTEVTIAGGPITRTITNPYVTSVALTIQFPSLLQISDKGETEGTSVSFAVDVQTDGGGWVEKLSRTVTGVASSTYEKQYRFLLPAGSSRQIRVRRITADSDDTRLANKTVFKSYVEIIDAKLRYPNSAIVGVRFSAEQFSNIPRRGFDVRLLKVRIPVNATVRSDGSLSYSGTWNGSFKIAWTTCPAWCYYDLVTNERYGLGSYIDTSQIDKWALYTVSKYCNELIPDGFGGTEPRFSCNIWLNERREAFAVVNEMTSIFRGMSYWSSGAVVAVQDAPKDPSYLFNNANVVEGQFEYQGSSAKVRHSVALVTWNDPADMYRQKVEYVEDTDAIARYGIIEAQVVAVGCTSRGQANRVGRWLLYSERFETDTVSFKTGAEGALVSPGDVIAIADQYRTGKRTGGRISSATSTTITVDDTGTLPTGTLTLYVVGPDGVAQNRTVSGIVGKVITATAPFDPVPGGQYVWAMSGTDAEVKTYRVLSASETDGEYEISALEHYPAKYALVEEGLTLSDRAYVDMNPAPAVPTGLTLTENTYAYQNTTKSKVVVSFDAAQNAARYRVEWRVNSGNYSADTSNTTTFEILDTTVGLYEVRVYALNAIGTVSPGFASASITTVGNSAPPAATSSLTATGVVGGVSLTWTSTEDALWQTEIYENTTNNSATATLVTTVSASSYTRTGLQASDGVRYYWVKLVNTSGVKSAFSNAASATAVSAAQAVSATMTPPTATVFTYANGGVVSFTPTVGQIKVYQGDTDVTASSTFAVTNETNCTGSVTSGGQYSLSAMTADLAKLSMTATYMGKVVPLTFTVTKSYVGYEIVAALPSSGNFDGRVVYLTTDGKLYRYVSGAWTAAVPAADISGTITTTQISDDAITAPKIAANAVTATEIAANAVTTDKINAGAITSAKLATTELITLSAQIGSAVVTNAKIADLAVDTLKIGNNAVTIPVSAYTSGSVTITYNTWLAIQSASITSTGAPILIMVSSQISAASPTNVSCTYRLKRGSTVIYTGTLQVVATSTGGLMTVGHPSFNLTDVPGAGTVTYTLEVNIGTSADASGTASYRSISLLEVKK